MFWMNADAAADGAGRQRSAGSSLHARRGRDHPGAWRSARPASTSHYLPDQGVPRGRRHRGGAARFPAHPADRAGRLAVLRRRRSTSSCSPAPASSFAAYCGTCVLNRDGPTHRTGAAKRPHCRMLDCAITPLHICATIENHFPPAARARTSPGDGNRNDIDIEQQADRSFAARRNLSRRRHAGAGAGSAAAATAAWRRSPRSRPITSAPGWRPNSSVRPQRPGPGPRRADQANTRPRPSNSRPSSTASMHRPRRRAARAADFFSIFTQPVGLMRPAEQPDLADAGQSGPHQRRPGAAAGQRSRPRARRPAPRVARWRWRRTIAVRSIAQAAAQPPQRGGLFESLFGAGSVRGQHHGAGRKHAGGLGLSHHLRAHVRRLLLPDLVFGRTEQIPRGREDLPSFVSRRRSAAVHPPQPRRGHQPGRLDRADSSTPPSQCLPVPAIVRQRLQLQRPERLQALKGGQDPHVAKRRRRGERRARQADVAAATRRAGQAHQARTSTAARQARSQGGGHAGLRPTSRKRKRTTRRSR